MTEDEITVPDHQLPTDPAPPMVFGGHRERRYSAKVAIPEDGNQNEKGRIVNILHGGVSGSVGYLESNEGAFRASHYHLRDSHRLHVVSGWLRYYERAVGGEGFEFCEIFGPGDTFDTPPMREHLLLFDKPTLMLSVSTQPRTHEEHEADVVRVPRESWGV
ncbi:MAG TPA: hypothetical protein VGK73_32705 [Polyangiaceae bacterium]